MTVLIGVSYQGRPVAGVIHQPFWGTNAIGRTVWAIKGMGVYGMEVIKSATLNSSSSCRECVAKFSDLISAENSVVANSSFCHEMIQFFVLSFYSNFYAIFPFASFAMHFHYNAFVIGNSRRYAVTTRSHSTPQIHDTINIMKEKNLISDAEFVGGAGFKARYLGDSFSISVL